MARPRCQGTRRTRPGSAAVVGGALPRMGSTGLPLEVALASNWTNPFDVTTAGVEAAGVDRASRRRPAARAMPNRDGTVVAAERAAAWRMQQSILGLPSPQVVVAVVATSERTYDGGHCGLAPGCEARTVQIQKDSLHSHSRSLRS